ncbi:L-threonine ammonia-lyase [Pseudonocardia hierapolitana]|uniref:threonine ammonia-lyase n=1 Tax=Pseudonocardia hierapolitana TaxID=1128676 RepID=A0A561SPR6_9PSEU|nr:threonine/serine dehydratase [Pseudonocardia hierapolitana]TWF76862.1 L-threonine ammonia-lyase [Pseudonocardia hierapolitana]
MTHGATAVAISPADVRRVHEIIRPHVRRTPVVQVDLQALAAVAQSGGAPVTLKLEQLQRSGSFKARGAFANLLARDVPSAGVVAASGGNHGVAVAFAAHELGVPAQIFVPTVSAPAKIARIRQLGAELVVTGERYSDALAAAEESASRSGALPVHAFDQRETILGQATLGLELAEQAPAVDTVLVPVGGGGLIAGIAAYLAGTVRVVGVEPTGAPTLTRARAHGAPVDAPTGSIAADALAPRRIGELVFPITQAHVHDVVLVDDESIRDAQRALWDELRLVAEPAAAVAVAAVRTGAYRIAPGERVAVVVSGANTEPGLAPKAVADDTGPGAPARG